MFRSVREIEEALKINEIIITQWKNYTENSMSMISFMFFFSDESFSFNYNRKDAKRHRHSCAFNFFLKHYCVITTDSWLLVFHELSFFFNRNSMKKSGKNQLNCLGFNRKFNENLWKSVNFRWNSEKERFSSDFHRISKKFYRNSEFELSCWISIEVQRNSIEIYGNPTNSVEILNLRRMCAFSEFHRNSIDFH